MTNNTTINLTNNPHYVRSQVHLNRTRQEQAIEKRGWRAAALYEDQANFWQDRLEELETIEAGDLMAA